MPAKLQARFDAAELAVALSHYDLGVIESITDFPRGSRRSPKVGIVSERGKFLLKRRSLGRIQTDRIRFTHEVLYHLIGQGFPSPKLFPTRDGRAAWLQQREYIYELFDFVSGESFRQTTEEAEQAGKQLAIFHQMTDGFEPPHLAAAPRGDYHDTPGVRTGLYSISGSLKSHDSFSGDEAELATLVQALLSSYDAAADQVNQHNFSSLSERITHCDWHPGNLVFRNQQVVGVIDYDAVRLSRRIVDVANGALQFSMMAGGDPAFWPDELDEARFTAFLQGYESIQTNNPDERTCLVPLMIEALISECVPPITQTGLVGRWSGYRVLQMVRRKVTWLANNAERLR